MNVSRIPDRPIFKALINIRAKPFTFHSVMEYLNREYPLIPRIQGIQVLLVERKLKDDWEVVLSYDEIETKKSCLKSMVRKSMFM